MGQLARGTAFEVVARLTCALRGARRLPYGKLLCTAVVVWLTVTAGIVLTRSSGVPAVWPANALLLVIILRASVRFRMVYLVVGLLASIAADVTLGDPSVAWFGLALCNLFEVGLAALLVFWRQRVSRTPWRDINAATLALFVGAVAPLFGRTLATAIVCAGDEAHFAAVWWPWYARDALGMIVALPFAFVVEAREITALFTRRTVLPTALTLAALLAVDAFVFGQQSLPVLFMIFPMLVWTAFRLGVAGVALAMLLTVTVAVSASAGGRGPLMLMQGVTPAERSFVLQLFLAIAACTTLPVAAVLRERDKLQEQLLARFTSLSESHGDLSKRNAQIEGLIALEEGITAALPSRLAVINCILKYAQEQTQALGTVMERVVGDELVYEVATGPFAAAVGLRVKRDASLSGTCSVLHEVLRCNDAFADDRVNREACRHLNIRSMIVVPIADAGVVNSVLKVASDRCNAFDEFDVLNLQLVARHLSNAMRAADEFERLARAGTEAQATIEHLTEGVVVFGADMQVLRYNAAAGAMLQMDIEQLPRWVNVGTLVDLDERELAPQERPVRRAFDTGEVQRDVIVGNGSLGINRRWISVTVSPVRFDGPQAERFILSARDVTELQQSDLDHREYVSQLRSLHLIASQVTSNRKEQIDAALGLCREELGLDWAYMGVLDPQTSELVIESSVGVGDMTGPQVLGARVALHNTVIGRVIESIESKEVFAVPDLAAALANEPEIAINGVWGAYIAVPIRVSQARYGAIGFTGRRARTNGFAESERDFVRITGDLIGSAIERGLQRERLDALAYFDALTGLPNRVVFQDRLVQTLLAAKRYEERFAVLYVDLDGFKAVNDGYGHGAGDEVLKIVGRRLEKLMRESDTVARIGGDEFLILASKIREPADAADLAWRVVHALRVPIEVNGRAHDVTASVGVSLYPQDGLDAETIVKRADAALYRAKIAGKNGVNFANASVAVQALRGPKFA